MFKNHFPRIEQTCNERGVALRNLRLCHPPLPSKRVTPQSRLIARTGIFFAPLDLRWGVTTEQSGSGQVIKLCLEEIDNSRPYFVCSLGFRNGTLFLRFIHDTRDFLGIFGRGALVRLLLLLLLLSFFR